MADNPGGGGYSDSTALLRAMLDADLHDAAFGVICDPQAVAECVSAGSGSEITLSIGGKIDAELSPPAIVSGRVMNITDGAFTYDGPMWKGQNGSMGRTIVLRVGGLDIVLTSNRLQVLERQMFFVARHRSGAMFRSSRKIVTAFSRRIRTNRVRDTSCRWRWAYVARPHPV